MARSSCFTATLGGAIESLLAAPAAEQPWEQVTDEYGTRHTAWRTADPKIIAGVTAAMRDKRLVIADGHHRYETALAYRNYCREMGRQDGRAEYRDDDMRSHGN